MFIYKLKVLELDGEIKMFINNMEWDMIYLQLVLRMHINKVIL